MKTVNIYENPKEVFDAFAKGDLGDSIALHFSNGSIYLIDAKTDNYSSGHQLASHLKVIDFLAEALNRLGVPFTRS